MLALRRRLRAAREDRELDGRAVAPAVFCVSCFDINVIVKPMVDRKKCHAF